MSAQIAPAPVAAPAQPGTTAKTSWIDRIVRARELSLVGVNAALAQQDFRRPPLRRALPWRRP